MMGLSPKTASPMTWIGATFAVGAIGGWISAGAPAFYEGLELPAFAPPAVLFPVVWTVLYLLMGIAAYLAAASDGGRETKILALVFYWSQLAVQLLWCGVFFRLGQPTAAFWLGVLLVLLAAATAQWFAQLDRRAYLLMLPYLAWLLFAVLLTFLLAKQVR